MTPNKIAYLTSISKQLNFNLRVKLTQESCSDYNYNCYYCMIELNKLLTGITTTESYDDPKTLLKRLNHMRAHCKFNECK